MPQSQAEKADIMKFESVLPENFDGVFRFTNWSDEDFIGKWGGKEYIFPAKARSPMIIPEHSPVEIQNIRKKFAKDLAEREFFKNKQYKVLSDQEGKPGNRTMNSIHQAATYNMTELAPFIQKALEDLPVAQAKVKPQDREPIENKLSRNEEGELNTEAIDKKSSLRTRALNS